MKRIFAVAAVVLPLALVSANAYALSCSGGRYAIIVNDGSTIGKEVCAGGTNTFFFSWLIGLFY